MTEHPPTTPDSARPPDARSLFRKAWNTPVRDALRGRLSARLDWRRVIEDAALPAPLAEAATSVVRRTRLWREEKMDVARELASHFCDAAETGDQPREIAASFGDPVLAARLIRRAKRRQRGPLYKALVGVRRTLGAVLLVAILWYAWAAVRFYTAEPNVAIDYVALLNEPTLAVPEEDRAWPLYREAYLAIPIEVLARNPNTDEDFRSAEPGDKTWPEAVAAVESIRPQLGMVRQASRRPAMGCAYGAGQDPEVFAHQKAAQRFYSGVERLDEPSPPRPSAETPFIEVTLDAIGPLRELTHLLWLDARVATEQGEADRTYEDLTALVSLGRHARGATLIEQLVHISITMIATHAIDRTLHTHPDLFSDAQLTDLAHVLGAGPSEFRLDLRGERAMFKDFVQRLYSDDGSGGGSMCAEGLRGFGAGIIEPYVAGRGISPSLGPAGPLFASLGAPRDQLMSKYEHFMTAFERRAGMPLWEWDDLEAGSDDSTFDQFVSDPINEVRYWLIGMLMPALNRASLNFEFATQQRDATLVAIALELHSRRHGEYPATLNDLVPSFLPAVPPDRYTGEPLRYRLDDEGMPILYSVGTDYDDDGGRPTVTSEGERHDGLARRGASRRQVIAWLDDERRRYDGDWILFPPPDED